MRDLLRSSSRGCTVHALLSDSLLWDSRKVSPYQFFLDWNDSLSCDLWRDVCCTSSIHARMPACMLGYDEMSRRFLQLTCVDPAEMPAVARISQLTTVLACSWLDFFVCFSPNEMPPLAYISFPTYCCITCENILRPWRGASTNGSYLAVSDILLHTKTLWRDALPYLQLTHVSSLQYLFSCSGSAEMPAATRISQFLIVLCMLKSCSVPWWITSLACFIWPTYVLRCFSSKCSTRFSHRRPGQGSSCLTEDILFVLYETYKQYACRRTSSSLCQCGCDLSGVANSCLT